MAHVREQDPIRFVANTVPFIMSINVAEIKIQKLIGSLSIWGLPTTIKSNIVSLFKPITFAELIGSRQRARSNQIQSQHCAFLHPHYRRRAKGKDAHCSLAHVRKQDPIRFKDTTVLFLTSITVADLKKRKLIGSHQRARSNQIQSQHCAVLSVHHCPSLL